jgi:hypothetical protein
VKRAAEIRNDDVVKYRIDQAEVSGIPFQYHINNECYKKYTLKKSLEAIDKKRKREEEEVESSGLQQNEEDADVESQSKLSATRSRASSSRNTTSSSNITKRDITHKVKCIVCNAVRCDGVREKSRMCEENRAERFLVAAKYMNDEVSRRLADVDNIERLIAADVYYHNKCMVVYLQDYIFETTDCLICNHTCRKDRLSSSLDAELVVSILEKARKTGDLQLVGRILLVFDEINIRIINPCFAHSDCVRSYLSEYSFDQCYHDYVLPLIDDMLIQKCGISMNDIREHLSDKCPELKFYNKLIKKFILENYGEQVTFCEPHRKYESEVVFSSSISPADMVKKIQIHESVAYTGKLIREKLRTVDFGLDDSFCDEADLHDAMKTKLPEEVITFLANLLNIPKSKFMSETENCGSTSGSEEEDEENGINNDDLLVGSSSIYNKKLLKANSLFQTMYYMINNGRKKSPLQVMVGHTVYDKCKSRELITSLNNLGSSISYSEIQRCRNKLGAYVISRSKGGSVPMPSHFNITDFTVVAFDNFDHTDRSSTTAPKDSHDTAAVLFQNKVSEISRKGKVSDIGIAVYGRKYIEELEFQKIHPYYFNKKSEMPLPIDFKRSNFQFESDSSENLIELVRTGIFHDMEPSGPTWSGINSLVSTRGKSLVRKKVGFLPFIPQPITEIQTVFSCLINFKKIASELKQPVLPVFCDEGVYHLAIKIYLDQPDMFNDIFVMLGSFHTAKAALKCAGKFIKGCGAEDTFIETGIFGPKTVETVISGSHYYRSFNGLVMLAESVTRLKYEAFHASLNKDDFKDLADEMIVLRQLLSKLNIRASADKFQSILQSGTCEILLSALDTFSESCGQQSQQCQFWNEFLRIIGLIKKLIKADREGDFLLHMKAVEELCPVFMGCGSFNYLRYGTFYVEQLKSLNNCMPELYASFMGGDFVVKRKDGRFNAVSPDMALEQTIQRSSKSTRGIIGKTKANDYVTEWALVSHEVLSIANTFRSLTQADKGGNNETTVHHQLRKSKIIEINDSVTNMTNFIRDRGNPYVMKESTKYVQLKNFVTDIYADEEVAKSRVCFQQITTSAFKEYHRAVYIDKEVLPLDTIHKMILNPVDFLPDEKANEADKKNKFSDKYQRSALKTLLIANDKTGDIRKILKYDITTYSYLFDRDYMTKPDKAQMVSELKELVTVDYATWSFQPKILGSQLVVIDFMSFIRSMIVSSDQANEGRMVFGTFIEIFMNRVTSLYDTSKMFHVIFDSYIEGSLKGSERNRRTGQGAIRMASIRENTPLPHQMKKFWKCETNKVMFQTFAQEKLKEIAPLNNVHIVFSGKIYNGIKTSGEWIHRDGTLEDIPELASDLEEADMRIIPHIQWHLNTFSFSETVVESNDTDVVVLLLYYMKDFKVSGLKKLWIHFGKGKTACYLPIHEMYNFLGPSYCKNLLKSHLGTGCDYLSKIGTKKSALFADPCKNLSSFGESNIITDEEITEAEKYLVRVYTGVVGMRSQQKAEEAAEKQAAKEAENVDKAQGKDKATKAKRRPIPASNTFDDLRYDEYMKKISVLLLPPTSHSMRQGHIRRWWYLYKMMSNLLNTNSNYKPTDYGWILEDGDLIPDKVLKLLPDEFSKICKCITGCITRHCYCLKKVQKCTAYCKCQDCKNK